MKNLFFAVLLSFSLLISTETTFAQETQTETTSNSSTDAGLDLVSAYIWRGIAFDNSPNIQAWGIYNYKNLTVGAWGSVSLNGQYYEPDLFLTYNFKNISLTITDVHGGFGNDFFNYKSNETTHLIDAMLAYQISESFPLKISGSVICYGFDKKVTGYTPAGMPMAGTNNNYSGYIELAYPIAINQNSLEFNVGFSTQESLIYATKGFAVINAGAKFSKEIKINDKFSVPLSFSFIANPDAKKVFTVLKLSI
jgi:hypothetical protein